METSCLREADGQVVLIAGRLGRKTCGDTSGPNLKEDSDDPAVHGAKRLGNSDGSCNIAWTYFPAYQGWQEKQMLPPRQEY